jgi:hypothetical protein
VNTVQLPGLSIFSNSPSVTSDFPILAIPNPHTLIALPVHPPQISGSGLSAITSDVVDMAVPTLPIHKPSLRSGAGDAEFNVWIMVGMGACIG